MCNRSNPPNFLDKCMDCVCIGHINPSSCDMSFITSSDQHQNFVGTLPPCVLFGYNSAKKLEINKSKRYRKNIDKKKEDSYQVNDSKRMEWMLPESTRVGEIFTAEAINRVPDFTPG